MMLTGITIALAAMAVAALSRPEPLERTIVNNALFGLILPSGYGLDSMNWLPSGSLNNANVPHGSFWGGMMKSTPRATSS
jgi:hypothetical protein